MRSDAYHAAFQDGGEVRNAAAVLQISEFNVFELAWMRWFGVEPENAVIEHWYGPYMTDGLVPHWVRHFCFAVFERASRGELDPSEFGVVPRVGGAGGVQRGILYAVLILAVVLILFSEAQVSAERMGMEDCMLPPCSTHSVEEHAMP